MTKLSGDLRRHQATLCHERRKTNRSVGLVPT